MSKLALFGGPKAITTPFPSWPVFDEEDEKNILQVLRSTNWWLYAYDDSKTTGVPGQDIAHSVQFERDLAAAQFVKHCYAVTSGTCALEIALEACGVGPGDEVITTPYTFVATSSSIFSRCALPVYVDIDPQTYNIDPSKIEEAITPKTKAILPVHFGGEIADMDAIMPIAEKHNLMVVEDAAQAQGAILEGNRGAGGLGHVGIFSFQQSKVMTAGEGGACTTQRDDLAEELWSLRNCGRSKTGVWYEHHRLGRNLRITEWQGAILRGQLRRLKNQCQTRYRNFQTFCKNIESIPGIVPCKLHPKAIQHSLYLPMFRFTGDGWDGLHRDQVIKALAAEGADASPGYGWPNYGNPVFKTMQEKFGHRAFAFGVDRFPDWNDYTQRCPVAERACSSEALWVSHEPFMGDEKEIQKLTDAFTKVYECRAELAK